MTINESRVEYCERFEELLGKEASFSDEETEFIRAHLENCPLGIHDYSALEKLDALPPGIMRNRDARDRVLGPDPKLLIQRAGRRDSVLSGSDPSRLGSLGAHLASSKSHAEADTDESRRRFIVGFGTVAAAVAAG